MSYFVSRIEQATLCDQKLSETLIQQHRTSILDEITFQMMDEGTVTWDSLLFSLITNSDSRNNIASYFVVAFLCVDDFHDAEREKKEIMTQFVRLAVWAIEGEIYRLDQCFCETVESILSLAQLSAFHGDVLILWRNFIATMQKFEIRFDESTFDDDEFIAFDSHNMNAFVEQCKRLYGESGQQKTSVLIGQPHAFYSAQEAIYADISTGLQVNDYKPF